MKKIMKPGDLFNQHKTMAMKKKRKIDSMEGGVQTKGAGPINYSNTKQTVTRVKAPLKVSVSPFTGWKDSKDTKLKKKNWIAGAIKKPGALHKELGVKSGKKIPTKTLAKAAKKGGKMGKRARLAETLKSFHKGKKK